MSTDDRIPTGLVLDGVVAARLEEAFQDGIIAFVRLYYRQYTDATALEPEALVVLDGLIDLIEADIHLDHLVDEIETRINIEGGVRSDTDGTCHEVRTFTFESRT